MKRFRAGAGPRLAGVLAGMLAWSCLPAAPIEVLRDCAAKTAPELAGIKLLGERCPQLAGALAALGLDDLLYDGWRERLNRDALLDLAVLADGYGGSRPHDPPDARALPGILQVMAREQTPAPPSWWEACKAWLRRWLGSHSETLSRLDHWLESLGGSVMLSKVISYSLVALVLLSAAAVIVNEFKAAGRPRGGRDTARPAAKPEAAVDPAEAGPEPAAPADKLAVLLRRLVERLMQTRRLDSERSLTHRELVSRSVFDSDAQRAAFARVARTAESVLYGSHLGAPEQLAAVLEEGRGLLAQLSAPPPASGAR